MLSTEENKQKLEMLIRTFFNRLHGYHVQYNIVSKETLIDAQKHPEKHKDLIVRVADTAPSSMYFPKDTGRYYWKNRTGFIIFINNVYFHDS